MLIVFTTTPDEVEAESLATKLVEQKLAACVQILPKIKSIYFWNSKVQNDSECLLLIKTADDKFAEIEQFINANHSYETPEVVAIQADNVSNHYLDWLNNYLETSVNPILSKPLKRNIT
jgi:periplasmic divalent cation tolerance protein